MRAFAIFKPEAYFIGVGVQMLCTDFMRRELQRTFGYRAVLVILATLFLWNGRFFAEETSFNQRVTWKYGKEGLPWKTTIKNPNGPGEYQLILQPLWAVDGGVLALEIVVARPRQPDVNIFGEIENAASCPFVIAVEELESGLAHSKFGAVRTLRADDIVLNVKIERFQIGRGVRSSSIPCAKCKNLQELSLWITVASKDKRQH